MTVITGAEIASGVALFSVSPGTSKLLSASPSAGQQGQNNLNVVLTGQFTSWTQGSTQASFGTGVTVNSVTVANATSLTANISIAGNAALGPRDITLTTGTEIVTLAGGFTIQQPSIGIPLISPVSDKQGQTLTLPGALTGQSTHWVQGTTTR